ncbi:TPA: LysR family transcriptional regulator [Escherichia coli]|nr:LysR family transcriptional regulator [Escherichia coli]
MIRRSSVTTFSDQFGITPPSVSNALKLLEEYIGHPLFVRTTRRILHGKSC